MTSCAYREQLGHFINGELFDAAEQEVEEHVESCTACQLDLEQLTRDDSVPVGSSLLSATESGRLQDSRAHVVDPAFMERLLREGPRLPSSELEVAKQDTPLPEQIGDYRIIREIGRGGMGVVYEAEQCSLERRVALKVLPRLTCVSEDVQIRFGNEARAAALMHHPNIVPVFDVGDEEGVFYYAMQLIQGRSLDHLIEQLKNSADRTLRQEHTNSQDRAKHQKVNNTVHSKTAISRFSSTSRRFSRSDCSLGSKQHYHSIARMAYQAANALAYAHERDVIHRDIKPSNLILDQEGVVWITDFGLAKTSDEGMTQSGDFLGTMRYISPERFSGVSDSRTDVYALGVTLYELLTLRPAFGQTDHLQLMNAICEQELPRPQSIDRRIPTDLESIVLKACRKQSQERYANAADFAADLERFLNDQPINAQRTRLRSKLARIARNNVRLVTGVAVATIFGVILGALFLGPTIVPITEKQNGNVSAAESDQQANERLREVTTALLRNGARIYSLVGDRTIGMKVPSDIPEEDFVIGIVDLSNAQRLEESLRLVKQLPKLSELWLKNQSLTKSMINIIAATRILETIDLTGTDVDDAGIEEFIGMPRLRELGLLQTNVTPGAVRRFKGLHGNISIAFSHNR